MAEMIGPLSDEFLRALGRVGADFALLEQEIAFLIWCLIGRDQRLGQIVTAELSFRGLRGLLSSVFRHRVSDEALIDELEKLLVRAATVEERRNIIVHSTWAVGDSPSMRTRVKMTAREGRGIRHQFEQMTPADIESVAESSRKLAFDIVRFTTKLPDDLVGRVHLK